MAATATAATALTEETLVDFLVQRGGRVRNKELVERFKRFINAPEPERRAKYHADFKDIVSRIAVYKQENGEKYVSLNKKYQYRLQQRGGPRKERETTSTSEACPGKGKSQKDTARNIINIEAPISKPRVEVPAIERTRMCEWITQTPEPPTQAPTDLNKLTLSSELPNDSQEISITGLTEACERNQDKGPITPESGTIIPVHIEVKVEEPEETEAESVLKDDSDQNQFEDGSIESASVALDPLEKEWLKCAASGQLAALTDLLSQDPSLAVKKDFTSGFTALHWAAKHGKEDMALLLIMAGVDINSRAHGYTPLHIAALHSHTHIMDILINNYGAKTNVRDYSGRFAAHYLKDQDGSSGSSNISSQFQQSRGERRNRKLTGLFMTKSCGSSKKWGSAENLATAEMETSQYLIVPSTYKATRKFSR
eukprot:gi/632939563/ref/XP_007910542.1/ PREDICTED: ankyrin repeat domain-containing protein SOWAHB-like [Callorhinchus milii]